MLSGPKDSEHFAHVHQRCLFTTLSSHVMDCPRLILAFSRYYSKLILLEQSTSIVEPFSQGRQECFCVMNAK